MTTTAERTAVPVLIGPGPDGDAPTCEHRGCMSAEPTAPGALVPGGPARPASWGGAGAGLAKLGGRPCPGGLDYCCGLCGCRGE